MVRLTKAEMRVLREDAYAVGCSLSQYVRNVLFAHKVSQDLLEGFTPAAKREFRRLSK